MFAVIGQKIYDKLSSSLSFMSANGDVIGSELISNTEFNNTNNWFTLTTPPQYRFVQGGSLYFNTTDTNYLAIVFTNIQLVSGGDYVLEVQGYSPFTTQFSVGFTPGSNSVYESDVIPSGDFNLSLSFTSSSNQNSAFLSIAANATTGASTRIDSISLKQVSGGTKIFPVIIPQGTGYPATTYEIANVSNFMSKGSSLASCDVSVNISCFADGYGTTYNQAKAVVEALDLYQVTYSEDGQSYTAKFRFMNLDDEYYKQPEKFYKNLTFNCLIIKN